MATESNNSCGKSDPLIAKILEAIGNARRILVASHASPDGDAIGSTLGLAGALAAAGKEVVTFNQDPVPESLRFLSGADGVVADLTGQAPFDLGFVLDAGELRRAGSSIRGLCRVLVNVDHHPYSEPFGDINYVDDKASATGALVFRILKAAGWSLSPQVATCLYTAILSDTGSFRYSNADAEAFRLGGDLVEVGVNPWDVASGLYESQPAGRLRLLGPALQTLTLSGCGRFATIAVSCEMMDTAGVGPELTDGFINYPRSINGVEVAVFFRQLSSDAYKVGFRSKGKVDVGALARQLGGGGHHNAAGVEMSGALNDVRDFILERLQALLPESP